MKTYDFPLKAVKFWLRESEEELSLLDLSRLIIPATFKRFMRARLEPTVEEMELVNDHYRIRIRGLSKPLYYPQEVPLDLLYQVMGELLDRTHPHYYERGTTPVVDDIVADCGAAEGLFGLTIAGRYRKLYLFEPLPVYQKSMALTYDGDNSVKIMPFALGKEKGKVYFHCDDFVISSRVASRPTCLEVEQRSLDELFFEAGEELTYIKADVEGAEISLMEGAMKTIKANRPKVAITTYHEIDHAKRIARMLREIEPRYRIVTNGVFPAEGGLLTPVMLHACVR